LAAAAPLPSPAGNATGRADPYRRLATTLRALLREQSAEAILDRVATHLRQLVECDDVVIWQLRNRRTLVPAVVDGEDADELRSFRVRLGDGITGSTVKQRQTLVANDAHTDPRAGHVPGTPVEPEAILCVPLIARTARLGALSLYRRGETRAFTSEEIELAEQFADIAAIALDNARTLARLKHLAATDELTGLANRRQFEHQLRREIGAAERHDRALSLLLLDLDNFKEINDTHGHETGDIVLRGVAGALRKRLRRTDIPARTGGDEFAIILPDTTRDIACELATELTAAIETTMRGRLEVSVSIGVAAYAGDRHALLRHADHHLYTRKRLRRADTEKAAVTSRSESAVDGASRASAIFRASRN
jgi:diguanylate cyclase (GGDEF)-like protein